jgi:hypothetical protein
MLTDTADLRARRGDVPPQARLAWRAGVILLAYLAYVFVAFDVAGLAETGRAWTMP